MGKGARRVGFEMLLGNDRLKENLRSTLSQGRASHFYLISGAPGSGRHTLARLLSAALQCQGQDKPCMVCSQCRKALAGVHPDIITVSDPQHATLPVKLVREAQADAYVRPNEGVRKIYLFPQELGLSGQNALLKILEEPPAYGGFLLLTDNPEKLLPTLRSRCVELRLQALKPEVLKHALTSAFPKSSAQELEAAMARSGGYLGQAQALLEAKNQRAPETAEFAAVVTNPSPTAFLTLLAPMEKWKREKLIDVLQDWLQLTQEALTFRSGLPVLDSDARTMSGARSPRELMNMIQTLKKAIAYAQGNVSPATVCGWLEWALRL